jgi:4-diphosphocytidyl-2-C-methyl-D-erythritol kinase
MKIKSNAKINIGLNILSRRQDNYHNIETIFYPLHLSDTIEITLSDSFRFTCSGLRIDGDYNDNLVVKAFNLFYKEFSISPVTIHLNKMIPLGAGLGGGSSNAAFTLMGLNSLFDLNLDESKLISYASMLGSDCPFFIKNCISIASGKGEILKPIDISLKGYELLVVKPDDFVSTKEAYQGTIPNMPLFQLENAPTIPISAWKSVVVNDFEKSVFENHPKISEVKTKLYDAGAVYASMSGSGASVFGIFKKAPENLIHLFPDCFVWKEPCLW